MVCHIDDDRIVDATHVISYCRDISYPNDEAGYCDEHFEIQAKILTEK